MARKGFTLVEIMIVVAVIALLAAIAVPNLMRARLASNEASAIATLKAISSAAHVYRTTYSGYPTQLSDLYVDETPPYIDSILAGGTKQGYQFTFSGADIDALGNFQGFTITANPLTVGISGSRYFFVDGSGVIRFNDDAEATVDDGAIE